VAGQGLYEAKKFAEAAEKFKESFRLSRKPVLLYNIALSLGDAGLREQAILFYQKFLLEAPKDAPNRADAEARLKSLENDLLDAKAPPKPEVKPVEVKPTKIEIKPPGTYKDTDFLHTMVEEAPPGKPVDLTAFVPEDSGWTVTLHYRGAGDDKFTPVRMKWRYKELVGRIPAAKMEGTSVQYYIEVKDQTGAVITKVAKASSPNLVFIEEAASARFYPDWSESGPAEVPVDNPGLSSSGGTVSDGSDNDNPLSGRAPVATAGGKKSAGGPVDSPGKGKYLKWGATGTAAVFLAASVVFYVSASKAGSTLEDEADFSVRESNCPDGSPCRSFDAYLQDAQSSGQRNETLSKVFFGAGLAATAVAGYFWYKDLTGKRRADRAANTAGRSATWAILPDTGGVSAAAAFRF
jgi:hypothetical protein